jgi:prolyl-tRNA editing enzyme YbaK/EbsC (Cys-tRNA(Pro) deacylase)
MVLVSGANRVHEKRAGRLIGEKLERADADFVKQHTGFSIGGVSPYGHPAPLDISMDEALLAFPTVWAAAGNPRSVFEIAPQELARTTGARRIDVT